MLEAPLAMSDDTGNDEAQNASQARWTRRKLLAIVVTFLVVAVVGAALAMSLRNETHRIAGRLVLVGNWSQGELALSDYFNINPGDPCSGLGGYSDVKRGAEVKVTDESGELLATGSLSEGHVIEASSIFASCEFSFHVAEVPEADFYTISLGNRGGTDYSSTELERHRWSVSVSLGG